MNLPEYITINGTNYSSAKLSDAAKGLKASKKRTPTLVDIKRIAL